MNKLIVALMAAALPIGTAAMAASPDKAHPPKKATEEATPDMKNPGGTENLHPPQKAMDEATPVEKSTDASSGDSSGTSGAASAGGSQAQQAKFPEWDTRKAGESVDLKSSGGDAK